MVLATGGDVAGEGVGQTGQDDLSTGRRPRQHRLADPSTGHRREDARQTHDQKPSYPQHLVGFFCIDSITNLNFHTLDTLQNRSSGVKHGKFNL